MIILINGRSSFTRIYNSKRKNLESFIIKQEENIFRLNIEIINQDITMNLVNENEIMKEYEIKLTLNKLKEIHKIFLMFTTCQEFLEYIKALIANKKISIKNNLDGQLYIEITAEYLFKQNLIKIDLIQKKISFELIAQDLYKKFLVLNEKCKHLEINYNKILQENIEIKEENQRIKEEIKIIKDKSNEKENINLRNDLSENESKKYNDLIKKNEDDITKLNQLIIFLKEENKKQIEELKEKYKIEQ